MCGRGRYLTDCTLTYGDTTMSVYILNNSALPDSYAYKLQAKAFTFLDPQEKQLTANVSGKKSFDFQASSLSLQASLTPLI